MRKTLLILLIFTLVLTSGFATKTKTPNKYNKKNNSFNNEFAFMFVPYAFQSVKQTNLEETKVNSEYAVGGKLRYTGWKGKSNFYFGLDCSYVLVQGRGLKDYSNLLALGKLGFQVHANDNIRCGLAAEAGMDVTYFDSKNSISGAFGIELFGDFRVAGNFSAVFTVDGLMTFTEKSIAEYRNFLVTTSIGIGYTF